MLNRMNSAMDTAQNTEKSSIIIILFTQQSEPLLFTVTA